MKCQWCFIWWILLVVSPRVGYFMDEPYMNISQNIRQIPYPKTSKGDNIILYGIGKASMNIGSPSKSYSEMVDEDQFAIYLCLPPSQGFFSTCCSWSCPRNCESVGVWELYHPWITKTGRCVHHLFTVNHRYWYPQNMSQKYLVHPVTWFRPHSGYHGIRACCALEPMPL